MFSGRMLPIHFPPEPDELLSSWYVRLAHANLLKPETLNTFLCGRQRQVWNRDIDRMSPEWLVKELAGRTGTPFDSAWNTTLKSYEGRLFPNLRQTGISPWILPVQMFHRKHMWPGILFCPECLKEDNDPYFRKYWRIALYTICHRHGVILHERCPLCSEPIMFHRRGREKAGGLKTQSFLSLCYRCNYDLREIESSKLESIERSADQLANKAIMWLVAANNSKQVESFYAVLHQISKILLSKKTGEAMRNYVAWQANVAALKLDHKTSQKSVNTLFLEKCSIIERHYILGLAFWVLANPANHLKYILRDHIVCTNKLYKDFKNIPDWYKDILLKLPHRNIASINN